MNNDLISREALKKELQSRPFPQDYSTTLLLGTFNDLIDNAPTVETRPKGEWKRSGKYEYECNICGEFVGYKHNFCQNCGADMRGAE